MDRATVSRLCRTYGVGRLRSAGPAGGTAGRNLDVTTSIGRFFLRCRSAEHAHVAEVRYDHDLMGFLAGHGLPVSPPVVSADSRTFVRQGGSIYELFRWVDGRQFSPGDGRQISDLGRAVARLHVLTADRRVLKDKPWEQDPGLLAQDLVTFTADCVGSRKKHLLARIGSELDDLQVSLSAKRRNALPHAVVHGDLHPGNAKFSGGRLVGLFDWDWANYRMRITDICDAICFFAHGIGAAPIDWDDIRQMTSGPRLDERMARALLEAYDSVSVITLQERELLNDFFAARWLQERIRGMRKVPVEQRLDFLDRGDLFDVLERLKTLDLAGS